MWIPAACPSPPKVSRPLLPQLGEPAGASGRPGSHTAPLSCQLQLGMCRKNEISHGAHRALSSPPAPCGHTHSSSLLPADSCSTRLLLPYLRLCRHLSQLPLPHEDLWHLPTSVLLVKKLKKGTRSTGLVVL